MTIKEAAFAQLRAALPDLKRQLPIRLVGICGSFARDDTHEESDLDIGVGFEKPIGYFEIFELEDALARITRRRVDLVMRPALKPDVSEHPARCPQAMTAGRDYRDFLNDIVRISEFVVFPKRCASLARAKRRKGRGHCTAMGG